MSLLSKNTSYLILFIIVIIGGVFRISGIDEVGFGMDDYDHIRLSLGENVSAVISQSYTDAHPPLRNIFLHFLLNISVEPWVARLVAIIPGISLIVAVYFLVLRLLNCRLVALLLASIIAYSNDFILLSQGTRPYMLSCLIGCFYLYCWFRSIETVNRLNSLLYCLAGLLLVFTEYSVIQTVAGLGILGVIKVFFFSSNVNSRQKYCWAIATTLIGLVLIAQIVLVYEFARYNPTHTGYLDHYMSLSAAGILGATSSLWIYCFVTWPPAKYLVTSLTITGLFFSIMKRQYLFLGVVVCTVLIGLILSKMHFFPYGSGRHSLMMLMAHLMIAGYGCSQLIQLPIFERFKIQVVLSVVFLLSIVSIYDFKMFGTEIHNYDHINFGLKRQEALNLLNYLEDNVRFEDYVLIPTEQILTAQKINPRGDLFQALYQYGQEQACPQHGWFDFNQCLINVVAKLKHQQARPKIWMINAPDSFEVLQERFGSGLCKVQGYPISSQKTHTYAVQNC